MGRDGVGTWLQTPKHRRGGACGLPPQPKLLRFTRSASGNACGAKDKKTPAVAIHGVLGRKFPGRHFPGEY